VGQHRDGASWIADDDANRVQLTLIEPKLIVVGVEKLASVYVHCGRDHLEITQIKITLAALETTDFCRRSTNPLTELSLGQAGTFTPFADPMWWGGGRFLVCHRPGMRQRGTHLYILAGQNLLL
jgi:hypothetical protein